MDLQLKRIRKNRRMTQDEMASRLGIKVRTYGTWERGERMLNAAQLMACASILDCSTDEILGMPIQTEFSDPREAQLHRIWRGLDRERQDRLLGDAQDMELAKKSRDLSAPPKSEAV